VNATHPPPLVSIGIPVRNGDRFLAEALDSLLAQTFSDFDVLIADNASTDGTAEIAQSYARRDARIRHHRHETNIGAAANFNFCFRETNGTLFKWAACDDRLAPTFLERCVAVLESRRDVVLAASRTVEIDATGSLGRIYDLSLRTDDPRPSVRFHDLIVVQHPSTLVFGVGRRDVLEQTRLIGNFVSADRVLLAELALRGRIVELGDPLFQRRLHEDNSIRLDKRGSLLAWYDPRLEGTLTLPSWRLAWEYVRAIRSAPLVRSERTDCYRAMMTHVRRRRLPLQRDLSAAIRMVAVRIPGIRRLATWWQNTPPRGH